MRARRYGPAALGLALLLVGPSVLPELSSYQDGEIPPAVFAKAETARAKALADLTKVEGDLRGHDQTIRRAEDLVAKAKVRNDAQVETAAREYLQKALDAKARDEATRARLIGALRAAEAGVEKARAAMGDWVKEYRALIADRLADAGTVYNAVLESVRARKDPPVPPRKAWSDLKPGDVLLVSSKGATSWAAMWADKLTSLELGEGTSRASHSFIYLKTVNGKKLFLDDQLGEGPRIKTEDMILREYRGRDMDVAHPIAGIDAEKLWTAARQLEVKNLEHIGRSAVGRTTYDLYGDDHMVCSEASRWALVEAWPDVPYEEGRIQETGSPFKKMLGVYFGPANFYADRQNFIVSGLDTPRPSI